MIFQTHSLPDHSEVVRYLKSIWIWLRTMPLFCWAMNVVNICNFMSSVQVWLIFKGQGHIPVTFIQYFKFCFWKYTLNVLKCRVRLHNAMSGTVQHICPAVCYVVSCSTSHYWFWFLFKGVLEITKLWELCIQTIQKKFTELEIYFDCGLESKDL